MWLRIFIPLIAMIGLRISQDLGEIAKLVHDDFVSSYQLQSCAREDVYARNIEDAFLYLQARFPSLEGEAPLLGQTPSADCASQEYSVYRETNEALDLLYPNWVYRQSPRPDDAR